MNCKQGELAVVKCQQSEAYGRMVEVCELLGTHPRSIDPSPHWWVKPCGWTPAVEWVELDKLGRFLFPDSRLRPIRDQPGEDETLRIAGKPVDADLCAETARRAGWALLEGSGGRTQ